jgi:hypothetical protein
VWHLLLYLVANAIHPEKDVEVSTKACDEEYYYYGGYNEKIFLRPSFSQIWIEFKKDTVSMTEAENFMEPYKFLHFSKPFGIHNQIIAFLSENSDCERWRNYLLILNKDSDIFAATPVFYLKNSVNNDFFLILINKIVLKPKNGISHEDVIVITNNYGLEYIRQSYGTYTFRVKNVVTGFEPIRIANKLFESGKTEWVAPDFICPINN